MGFLLDLAFHDYAFYYYSIDIYMHEVWTQPFPIVLSENEYSLVHYACSDMAINARRLSSWK